MATAAGPDNEAGRSQHHWIRIVVLAMAVVIVALLVVPFLVNVNTFRPMLESELSSALGRKVTLGHLSLSLWSGGLVANNVTVADDPQFGSAPFFQAKSLRIGVQMGTLLFHHQLVVEQFVADSPQIHLIENQNGMWNFSSLGSGNPGAPQQASSAKMPQVTVGELKIQDGKVFVSSLPATGEPFVYSNVNIAVKNLSTTQAMPFSIAADLPGNGSVKLVGSAGPLAKPNAEATPFRASLDLKHFNPVAAGVLPASDGISMIADANVELRSNGTMLTGAGGIQASHLLLSRDGTPAPQPVEIEFTVGQNLTTRVGQIQSMAIHAGSATVQVNGSWVVSGQTTALNLNLSAPSLPINQLEQFLPAVGVRLPRGSRLQGGTLTATLAITGTASSPAIDGPVELDGTKLVGYSLGKKIQGLTALAGIGNSTDIQTLRAQVHSTVPMTQLSNIYASVPALGTAIGSGSVSAAGALNFQLTAKLNANTKLGGLVSGVSTALGGTAGKFLHGTMSNGVPMTITGTTSDPVIRVELGKMLGGGQKGKKKQSVGDMVRGLLGK
jgi:AsmA protein